MIIHAPSCYQTVVTARYSLGLYVHSAMCDACHDFRRMRWNISDSKPIIAMQSGGRCQSGGDRDTLLLLA